ncbi:MAG TPA: diacylglycerol kinase family protein [Patescibacteria group bacterium]|nr:diacylglycerol kinase family protein [Patescibacteria group bacterium]
MNFEQFVIISNPASTNAQRMQNRIAELKSLYPNAEITMIQTSPQGRAADKKILSRCADKLGQGSLLCVAAGDGTINTVVQELLTDTSLSKEASHTPLLPLWGGNANDLASMLNGPSYSASLKRILESGRIVTVSPLECHLTASDRAETIRYATCYASFGASAFVAGVLAKFVRRQSLLHKLPGGRFLQELSLVARALMQAPTFAIRDDDKIRAIYERAFLKGSRFAKTGGVPQRLTDDTFHAVTVGHKRLLTLMYRISEMTRRSRKSKFVRKHTSFTVLETAWAQFDGETERITAGTKIDVRLSKKPFYALSTRLADK